MLDGPASEIERWIALDVGAWPFGRDHEANPVSDGAIAAPPPPIRPRTRLIESDGVSLAICDVVEAWRAAERELAGLVENEPEWNRVTAEIIGVRALHQRLFEARLGSRPGRGDAAATRPVSGTASNKTRERSDAIE